MTTPTTTTGDGTACCRCGAALPQDAGDRHCADCTTLTDRFLLNPPEVSASFWEHAVMRAALADRHMGRVVRAFRTHPHHRRPVSQETAAAWFGVTQGQLSRVETGPPVVHLDRLSHWARVLRVPAHLLWFTLGEHRSGWQASAPHSPAREAARQGGSCACSHDLPESGDMHRRELLRLLSTAGALVTAPAAVMDAVDPEQVEAAARTGRVDAGTADTYANLNAALWASFMAAQRKQALFPAVRDQLGTLTAALGRPCAPDVRLRLSALVGDLFQLAGEIAFDGGQYTDAAHAYTLAATASREAGAFDLWACAMTRHAFVSLYEQRFDQAAGMLDLAAGLARRGDTTLATRHWVAAVHAQALAGLGETDACRRALDTAEEVRDLRGPVHNGGWLRFDGSRLAEERGACHVVLYQPGEAETALTEALAQDLSTRRRGGVLVGLAAVGAQQRDPDRVVGYANAALDTARQSGSGVVAQKLRVLQRQLGQFGDDRHVRHLDERITALTTR